MGKQQILLSVLALIIVGIATNIGITIIRDQYLQSNRTNLILDITTISFEAQKFRLKPKSQAGGNGSYLGISIQKLNFNLFPEDPNGFYSLEVKNADEIVITGTGNVGSTPWIVEASVIGSGITTIKDTQTAVW